MSNSGHGPPRFRTLSEIVNAYTSSSMESTPPISSSPPMSSSPTCSPQQSYASSPLEIPENDSEFMLTSSPPLSTPSSRLSFPTFQHRRISTHSDHLDRAEMFGRSSFKGSQYSRLPRSNTQLHENHRLTTPRNSDSHSSPFASLNTGNGSRLTSSEPGADLEFDLQSTHGSRPGSRLNPRARCPRVSSARSVKFTPSQRKTENTAPVRFLTKSTHEQSGGEMQHHSNSNHVPNFTDHRGVPHKTSIAETQLRKKHPFERTRQMSHNVQVKEHDSRETNDHASLLSLSPIRVVFDQLPTRPEHSHTLMPITTLISQAPTKQNHDISVSAIKVMFDEAPAEPVTQSGVAFSAFSIVVFGCVLCATMRHLVYSMGHGDEEADRIYERSVTLFVGIFISAACQAIRSMLSL